MIFVLKGASGYFPFSFYNAALSNHGVEKFSYNMLNLTFKFNSLRRRSRELFFDVDIHLSSFLGKWPITFSLQDVFISYYKYRPIPIYFISKDFDFSMYIRKNPFGKINYRFLGSIYLHKGRRFTRSFLSGVCRFFINKFFNFSRAIALNLVLFSFCLRFFIGFIKNVVKFYFFLKQLFLFFRFFLFDLFSFMSLRFLLYEICLLFFSRSNFRFFFFKRYFL
jgi:hypothetical protein